MSFRLLGIAGIVLSGWVSIAHSMSCDEIANPQSTPQLQPNENSISAETFYKNARADADRTWATFGDLSKTDASSTSAIVEAFDITNEHLEEQIKIRKCLVKADCFIGTITGLKKAKPLTSWFDLRLEYAALKESFKLALVRDMGILVAPSDFPRVPRRALDRVIKLSEKIHAAYPTGRITLDQLKSLFIRKFPTQRANIESLLTHKTVVWVDMQLHEFIRRTPAQLINEGSYGKLLRSIMGTVAFSAAFMPKDIAEELKEERLARAVKAGFYFGVTYLFDDLMDTDKILSSSEKKTFFKSVLAALQGADVSSLPIPDSPAAAQVFESYRGLLELYPFETNRRLYYSYLTLAMAQIEECNRNFESLYTENEIYGPLIVKSAYTRILPAVITDAPITDSFVEHSNRAALVNQLMDDFHDFYDDYEEGVFTPFTYYAKKGRHIGMEHPFKVYLSGIAQMIAATGGPSVQRVWMIQVFRTLKQFKNSFGRNRLEQFFKDYPLNDPELQAAVLRSIDTSELIPDHEMIMARKATEYAKQVRGF